MATRVVTAHLPEELARKLDGLADRLDRPRGRPVKGAVEAYVGLAEDRDRETRAALDEVEAGHVMPHAEVEAWASGLAAPRRRRKRSG